MDDGLDERTQGNLEELRNDVTQIDSRRKSAPRRFDYTYALQLGPARYDANFGYAMMIMRSADDAAPK